MLDFALNHLGDFLLQGQRRQDRLNTTVYIGFRVPLPYCPEAQDHNHRHRTCAQIDSPFVHDNTNKTKSP